MKNLITLTILIVMVAGIATATVATETVMAKKHHSAGKLAVTSGPIMIYVIILEG